MTASHCVGLLPSSKGCMYSLCPEACTRLNTYIMYRARTLRNTYILCEASSGRADNLALFTYLYIYWSACMHCTARLLGTAQLKWNHIFLVAKCSVSVETEETVPLTRFISITLPLSFLLHSLSPAWSQLRTSWKELLILWYRPFNPCSINSTPHTYLF